MQEMRRQNKRMNGGGGSSRLTWIDSIKGFAAICVVLDHVAVNYFDAGIYQDARLFEYLLYSITSSFHMALFMTVSGFLFARSYMKDWRTARRERVRMRIFDMVAVYVLFSVLYGISRVVFGRFAVSENSLLDVALILFKPLSVYWFLYVLIVYYALFPLIVGADRRIVFALLSVCSIIGGGVSCRWFALDKIVYYALFFYLGMSYREENRGLLGNRKAALIFGTISVVLFTALNVRAIRAGMPRSMAPHLIAVCNTLIALGFVLVLWMVFQRIRQLGDSRLLALLGRYSLEIYVLQCVFIAGWRVILPCIGIVNGYLSIAVNFILSTWIPVAFGAVCRGLHIHGLFFSPVSTAARFVKED